MNHLSPVLPEGFPSEQKHNLLRIAATSAPDTANGAFIFHI